MIRLFNHFVPIRLLLLSAVEALVLFQAAVLGFGIRLSSHSAPLPLAESALFCVVMLFSMTSVGLYQGLVEPLRQTCQRLVVAYAIAALSMAALLWALPPLRDAGGAFVVPSIIAVGAVVLVRALFFHVTDVGLPRRRVLVLGSGDQAEGVIRLLHEGARRRAVQYAGMYPVDSEAAGATGDPTQLPRHDHLLRTVRDLRVSEIVIAVRERRGGVLPLRQLLECKLRGIRVLDVVSFYERECGVLRLDQLRASWLIFGDGFERGMTRDVVKRVFDVTGASLLIVVLLPPALLAWLLLRLTGSGTVLVRERRLGQGGVAFQMWRLRTQAGNDAGRGPAAGGGGSLAARIARRCGIDELPQLIHVLLGRMSFVGPRPEHPEEAARRIEALPYYEVRSSLKPGITGWAQVRERQAKWSFDAAAQLEHDLYYVKNHSLFMDLLILVQTVQVVLLGRTH